MKIVALLLDNGVDVNSMNYCGQIEVIDVSKEMDLDLIKQNCQVERIIADRLSKGLEVQEYLVKWQGLSYAEATCQDIRCMNESYDQLMWVWFQTITRHNRTEVVTKKLTCYIIYIEENSTSSSKTAPAAAKPHQQQQQQNSTQQQQNRTSSKTAPSSSKTAPAAAKPHQQQTCRILWIRKLPNLAIRTVSTSSGHFYYACPYIVDETYIYTKVLKKVMEFHQEIVPEADLERKEDTEFDREIVPEPAGLS